MNNLNLTNSYKTQIKKTISLKNQINASNININNKKNVEKNLYYYEQLIYKLSQSQKVKKYWLVIAGKDIYY